MAATIGRITVYKLKMNNFNEINLSNYDQVKDDVIEYDGNSYPFQLYFLQQEPTPVDWYAIFDELNLNIEQNNIPHKLNTGFIFIIKINDSYYGLTGGLGHIHLRKNLTIEHRFGIDIAEKIISLSELRGLAQKDTSGIVNSLDRVFRGRYNPNGDINNLKRVLTHVRGQLRKENQFFETIGKTIQASDALSVNGTKSFPEILEFLLKIEELYNSSEHTIVIPQLEFIDKKFYHDLLIALDNQLLESICNYNTEDNTLFIDNEYMGYLPDRIVKYQLFYNRTFHECDTYEEVFTSAKTILDEIAHNERTDAFNKMNLKVIFEDEHYEKRELFYFICGDVTYQNEVYFINNKFWYKASEEFVRKLNGEIDNIEFISPENLGMIEWDIHQYPREDEFNINNTAFICLDKRLVSVEAERGGIEFCDLLKQNGDQIIIVHVKKDCGAALRGLFAQGFVSAKLYDEDTEFKTKVHNADLRRIGIDLTDDQLSVLLSMSQKHKRQMKIVYAMFDDTQSHSVTPTLSSTSAMLNGTLSTFAKVDLLERVNSIRAMGYEVAVTRIKPYPVRN